MLPRMVHARMLRARMAAPGDRAAGGAGGPPQRGRIAEFFSSVPLVTLILLCLNVTVYVFDNLGDFGANISAFAIQPYSVIQRLELWRLVTAAFVHGGLMHIGMNMMSLFQLGSGLEPLFGSLQYAFILAVFTIAVGTLYVAIAWLLSIAVDAAYLYSSAVGFSGVLFAMAVDEASLSPAATRSLFGLFSVPTKLYPWVLMLVLQLVLPNVSFLGHLSGVLIGFAHTWGAFAWAIPSLVTLRKVEAAPWFGRILRCGPYRLVPAQDATALRGDMSVREQLRAGCACIGYVLRPCTDCFARTAAGARFQAWMQQRGGAGGAGAAPPLPAPVVSGTAAPVSSSGTTAGAGRSAAAARLQAAAAAAPAALPARPVGSPVAATDDYHDGGGDLGSGLGGKDASAAALASGATAAAATRAAALAAAARARAAAASSKAGNAGAAAVPLPSAPAAAAQRSWGSGRLDGLPIDALPVPAGSAPSITAGVAFSSAGSGVEGEGEDDESAPLTRQHGPVAGTGKPGAPRV